MSIALLELAAAALGGLVEEVAFTGGATGRVVDHRPGGTGAAADRGRRRDSRDHLAWLVR